MSSEHIGRDTTIEAFGQSYKLPRLTRGLREKLTAWAIDRLSREKSTLEQVTLLKGHLAPEGYESMVLASWRSDQLELNFFHPRVEELCQSPEGLEKGLTILLMEGNPELTEDKCIDILGEATYCHDDIEYLLDKWRQVEGRTPNTIIEALKKNRIQQFRQSAMSNLGLPSTVNSINPTV